MPAIPDRRGASSGGPPAAPGRPLAAAALILTVLLLWLGVACGGGGGASAAPGGPGGTFTVTFLAGPHGSLAGSASQTVAAGSPCTAVTAVPDPGCTFTGWTGAGFTATAANPLTVANVAANLILTAGFAPPLPPAPPTFTVTFLAGTHGSLSGSTSQTVPEGGACAAVTALPDLGYRFVGWTGAGFTPAADNPLTVANVTSDLTLTATFTPRTFTVTFLAGANGSLGGSTSQTVAYGSSCTPVTALPATGYACTGWTGPGFTATAANPLTVANVTSDLTLTAGFTPQTFTVTFLAGANGSLGGSASQTVAYGGACTAVTALPATGYACAGWTGPGFTATAANPLTVANVTSDLTLTAGFTPRTFTVTFLAGANGSLSGSASQTVAYGGACTAVTALPATGYACAGWTGPGFTATAANPLTVADVTSDQTLTAGFAPAFTVDFLPGTGGSLTGTASQTVFANGACSQVTAVPGPGYAFINWTGTGGFATTAGNPLTVAGVTAAMTVTAHFGQLPVIGSFYATSTTIGQGFAAYLNWDNLQYCTFGNTVIDNGLGVLPTPAGTFSAYPAATTTYTITATNAYGSTSRSVTVTVVPPPVILSFTATPAGVAAGAATTLAWTSTGAASFSINQGIGAVTGTSVSVVPPAQQAPTTYRLTANNGYGTTRSTTVQVTSGPPVNLRYLDNPVVYNRLMAIEPDPPGNLGGVVTAYTVTPSLPPGLALDPATGVISGTPSATQATASYVVRGSNAYDYAAVTLVVTVNDTPPFISYPGGALSHTFYLGTAVTPLVPGNSGGAATAWSIAPALPANLQFDPASGTISGTPTGPSALGTYTVTASNLGGSSFASLAIAVAIPGPVLTVQPAGQILSPGATPSFSVTATGTGALAYQWYRDQALLPGATASSYSPGTFSAADDGAGFTVTVSDAFGGSTTSRPAMLSLFQDLGAWLGSHPAVAAAIRWQFQPANSANVYIAPDDSDKLAWPAWSPGQQADLNQAYLDAVAWFNAGAQPVAMVPGGTATTLTDQPANTYVYGSDDAGSTIVTVSPAYMWRLFTGHVAFSLMLEGAHQLPWTVTGFDAQGLRYLFDSSVMGWLLASGDFDLGTYPGAGMPALRADNRPRTTFADPRWTYPWLQQAGIIGATRQATIGGFLDWMRSNLTHVFGGADTFGRDNAIWQYRGYSPISRIVGGTVDAGNPGYGAMHWTEGCHGSTGLISAALRVLNLPVQPVWACGHELVYFVSEDLYLDHADDPYNGNVRASSSPSRLLLLDAPTWASRFGADTTVNFLNYADPVSAWIGYAAAHFPP